MRCQCLLLVIDLVLFAVDADLNNATYPPCETPQYVPLGEEGVVHCNFTDGYFGIFWYNSTEYVSDYPLISIKGSEHRKDGPGFTSREFDVYPNGSLIIKRVAFEHAHRYTVVKLTSSSEEIIPHYVDVIVKVLPTPPYPVIEQCQIQQACILRFGYQGNLTCSVLGILPNVSLEWRGVDGDASVVFNSSQGNTSRRPDGRYNVSLTSSFYANRSWGHYISVECRVTVQEKGPMFDLRSPLLLQLDAETAPPAEENKRTSAAVIAVPVVVFLIVVSSVLVYFFKIKVRMNNTRRKLGTTTEEGLEDAERTKLLDDPEIEHLKQALKDKYKEVFASNIVLTMTQEAGETKKTADTTEIVDNVQTEILGHIGDTKERQFSTVEMHTCDDNISIQLKHSKSTEEEKENDLRTISDAEEGTAKMVGRSTETSNVTEDPPPTYDGSTSFSKNRSFSEPMVQILTSKPWYGAQGIWKNCISISQALTEPTIESKRLIFEGEFGYEFLTISELLAWEWSMEEGSLLASHFDVLIVLQLNQVSGDKSLYSEIRRLFLSNDTSLTTEGIQRILENHDKVALVLNCLNANGVSDCKSNREVAQIIQGEILQNCTVILFGPPSCVPNDSKPEFIPLRGKNLSTKDQDFLIGREVPGKQDIIKSFVNENILLRDILQIPLFFEMFLDMVRDMVNMPRFQSFTIFFLRIMSRDYFNTLKNAGEPEDVTSWDAKLGEVAFYALKYNQGNNKRWRKDEMCGELGGTIYHFYHQMGVLMEEKTSQWGSQSTLSENPPVRFAHSLFCEWYAAKYLSKCLKENDVKFEEELSSLISNGYWYCIRFLYGITVEVSREMFKVVTPKVLQILCQLEYNESVESILDDVKSWCSNEVPISREHSKVHQMAIAQLLELNEKASHLTLDNCFNSVEGEFDFLEFRSGLQLPVIKNLKRLDIIEEGREFTNEEVTGVLKFVSRCSVLENVKFLHCMLPRTIETMPIAVKSKLKDVKVEWIPFNNDPSHVYYLIVKDLIWKRHRGDNMNNFTYRGLVEEFRDQHGITF